MTSGVSYDTVRDAGPSWRAGHPARASRHGAQCSGCVIVQQCVKCPDKRWQPPGRPAPSTSCNLWYPITRFNDTKRHCPRLNCNTGWGKDDIYENYLVISVTKYLEFFCKSGNRFTCWTPVNSTWNVRRFEEPPSGRVVWHTFASRQRCGVCTAPSKQAIFPLSAIGVSDSHRPNICGCLINSAALVVPG